MSHLTEIPHEDPDQIVFRLCAQVHAALDKQGDLVEPAPSRYQKTVFGKSEATRVDVPTELQTKTETMIPAEDVNPSRVLKITHSGASSLDSGLDDSSSMFAGRKKKKKKFPFLLAFAIFVVFGVVFGAVLLKF